MDALPPTLRDSLLNLATGLGTVKARNETGQFTTGRRLLQYEIDALYTHNSLAGKIVDLPVSDMLRQWREWYADRASIEAIEATERRLHLRQRLAEALKLARKDGGSVLLIGTGDADPATPLNISSIPKGGLRYIHVFSRNDIHTIDVDRDPASEFFGQPLAYVLFRPNATNVTIHPSRMIQFIGTPRLDRWAQIEPWGDSIYERLHDPIRAATAAFQGVSALIEEAKIDVINIPGLTENSPNETYRNAVIARFGAAMAIKSISNALLLDELETWEQRTLTFAGWPQILDRLLQAVCAAADIPVTRLLGESPGGLNSSGRTELESYYTMIGSLQETSLRPTIERLDDAIVRSAMGRMPRGVRYEWRGLWSPSDVEKADIAVKKAQAIKYYKETGLFTHESLARAAAKRTEDDDFLTGLMAAPEPPPEPVTEPGTAPVIEPPDGEPD